VNNKDFKRVFYLRLIRFSLNVIRLCRDLHKDPALRIIANQLIRSATSIGANVIEAKSCSTKKEYINFFHIALKSANETKYWLILIRESNSGLKEDTDKLLSEVDEICKILSSGILTMKGYRKS